MDSWATLFVATKISRIETLTPRPWVVRCMSERQVTPDDVRHIATLARIDLADEDVDEFTDQFEAVLEYFEGLEEVPAVDAEPELTNVLRPDEVDQGLSQAEALENADDEDGYFKGPNVS